MRTGILIVIMIIAVNNSYGQEFLQDMQKMYDAYKGTANFSMNIIFNIYNKKSPSLPEVQKGVVKKLGALYYTKFYDNEMVVGKKYTIMVDYSAKEVYAFISDKSFQPGLKDYKIPDSLNYLNKKVEYKGIVNGSKCYILKNPTLEITKYEIYLDAKTGFLSKLVYIYNQNEKQVDYGATKIETDYLNVDLQTIPAETFFSTDKFISVKSGKLALGPAYTGYTLIDLTKKETNAAIR